jgi:hypothetical protein
MWMYFLITINILSVLFLPYLLCGGVLKLVFPYVKPNYIAASATLLIAYLDQEYHCFGNIFQLNDGMLRNVEHLNEINNAGIPFWGEFMLLAIPRLLGMLIVPFCFAKLGVMIVNKIKKNKLTNSNPIFAKQS